MTAAEKTILELSCEKPVKLTAMQGWDDGFYKLSDKHVGAIQAAYLSNRPLLVRGDPGLGKSQLAQAIASLLSWGMVSAVVHYNTSFDDLLFAIDHVQRLDAANRGDDKVGDLVKYLKPGKVWQAVAPDTLKDYTADEPYNENGTVLLIDEIDKADSTLPNALLEVLDKGAINVPYLAEPVKSKQNHPYFVVITSNDERILPQAFLRRCAVLDIQMPANRTEAIEWLEDIFKTHYPDKHEQDELQPLATKVAEMVVDHRNKTQQKNDYLAGTSEFLDMLRTLVRFDPSIRDQKLALLSKHLVEKSQYRSRNV